MSLLDHVGLSGIAVVMRVR